jgi:two-component system sensor histidine kinase MprB
MIARLRRLSFRARLGTFTAVAVGVTVALASLASYFVVRHQLYAQVDSSLRSEVSTLASNGFIDPLRAAQTVRRDGGFFQVITSTGQVEQSSLAPYAPLTPTRAETSVASSNGGSLVSTVSYGGAAFRVLTEQADSPAGPEAIQIGRPLNDIYRTLSTLRLILWLVSIGGVGAAVVIGFLIGRATMRPVERLTAAAEHVAATQDLGARIDETGDDELARLARSFNSMLTALAASRQEQAQLISDAGHELRTPLTSLRTNIEVLLRQPDLPPRDRTELTRDVEAQLAELTNLIGDVVDLARHEEQQAEPIEARFDHIVSQAVERARRRAPAVTFETRLTPGAVRAQPALLERAVLNVLDNAAKWSPPGGTVEVWLQRGAVWTLDVHDHGPGIAPEDIPHVFDRFYRAASARAMPGSGLGLAIVRQVVTEHGGRVEVSVPPEGGTVVHMELPTVLEAEPEAGVEPAA